MSVVVEHLAALTGYRDRDVLDVSLVGALRDLLHPLHVAIYRSVGDGDDRRWLTRAHLTAGDHTATADSLWADPATLPPLPAYAERYACLQSRQEIAVAGHPALSFFPLGTDGDVVGVLEVASLQPLAPEQSLLVSSILRVYRNFQGLLDYSERDTLTGLLNRKTFDESFMRHALAKPSEVAAAVPQPTHGRRGAPGTIAWLGIIDIDHFKRVNDNYGHLIGDEVLLLLARLMRGSFRYYDQLFRFGGEEFAVLMRCPSAEAAAGVLERLRRNVENYVFPRVGRISISVGFTALQKTDTPSAAFERADKAVYYAKAHGRNQVASHAALVAGGLLEDGSREGGMELF